VLADEVGSDAIPDAAGGEGGHGAAKVEGVIHRYVSKGRLCRGPKWAPALWGDRNGLQPTRPAKVVPMSMAGSDSVELFMRACNGNREHATSGQEQQERRGERWPSAGGAGGVSGRAKRRGA
jgi:hypothetical protein